MAEQGTTVASNIQTPIREVDFVSQFQNNWDHLRDILGVTRVIRKTPGTMLKSKYAEVNLKSGLVAEGEKIPFSEAMVKTKDYAPIVVEKFAKAVTIEAINEHGYEDAVNMTDDQFRFELTTNVTGRFYDFLNTGTLISSKATFQAALAEAQGQVRRKWKNMHKGITTINGFCNILDAYDYLGAANITVQNAFGMNYIENFIGYQKLFLCGDHEIPRGVVAATPTNNMILYYVAPSDSDFAKAGLQYTTEGETNLIGYRTVPNYSNATSEAYAIMGLTLMAEYIDGIAIVYINDASIADITVAPKNGSATIFNHTVSDLQEDVAISGNVISGTLKYVTTGDLPAYWGPGNFLALDFGEYVGVKVGLVPTQGSGMKPLDIDKDAAFKITDPATQKLLVQKTVGDEVHTQIYSLAGLVCEGAGA